MSEAVNQGALTTRARPQKSVALAVLASVVFPGLGQLYLGRRRSASVYALPVIGLMLIIGLRVLSSGLDVVAIEMFSPSTALTVLGIIVAAGLWWLVAMLDAFTAAGGRRKLRTTATVFTAVLGALVIGTTAYGAFDAWSLYQAGSQIFVGGGPDNPASTPPSTSASGAATPLASDPGIVDATPISTPTPGSTRITVLLTGLDWAPTRDHALNDTMIVVSLDKATGKMSMVSFARDIAGFKLWTGKTFPGKLNSLMSAAQADPADYPLGGINTLVKELTYLLGIPINYYAAVNLPGFTALVDAAGGVTVHNDTAIDDPQYGGWTDTRPIGFHLGVGTFTLDGQTALAYARSRFGPANNDFVRARRQQQLILALETKLTSPAMLPRLPGIIKALANTVRTNYPADQLSDVLAAAKTVDSNSIDREVLGPPFAVRSNDPTTYSLTLDMSKITALSLRLYGSDSLYAQSASGGGASPAAGSASPGP